MAEVKSLQIIRDKGIPDAQTLISSAVARSGRNGSVIGIIVSELARGVQFIKLQDQIIQEKLPISIALQVYQRMAGTALALAQQGIAVDDLSPDHFIIELNSKNKIESARLVDFGSATFFDHEDIDCARRDNLEALCYGLAHLKLGQPSSRILEVVGYLEDAISDLNDGVVDFKTFSADLAKYQLNHT